MIILGSEERLRSVNRDTDVLPMCGGLTRAGCPCHSRVFPIAFLLLQAAACFAAAPTTSPTNGTSRESFSDKYATVVDHNIFLRERGRREHTSQPTTQPREPAPEELVWLSGVAMEPEGFRAYIEDVSGSYAVKKLAPGDAIARGKVTVIEIDAIEYEAGGQRTWITIGSDFTGKPATVSTSSSYASTTSSEAPTTAASGSTSQPSGNSSNASMQSLEERMRQRRSQELRR